MQSLCSRILVLLVTTALLAAASAEPPASFKTRNVFLIISDGLRWQEIFNGAEEKLLTKEKGGVKDPKTVRAQFCGISTSQTTRPHSRRF